MSVSDVVEHLVSGHELAAKRAPDGGFGLLVEDGELLADQVEVVDGGDFSAVVVS